MRRYILAGAALAILTALLVGTGILGADAQSTIVLGVALGGVLGLVREGSLGGRLGAFGAGIVLAWVGYILRAAGLPDADSGRAVAALVVLGLCVVVAVVSRGRLPLWALLVGVAGVVGAYEAAYSADPGAVATTSVAAVTSVLLSSAIGFVVTTLLAPAREDAPAGHVATAPTAASTAASTAAPAAQPAAEPDNTYRPMPAPSLFLDPQPEA